MLVVVKALRQFRPYLLGRECLLRTDHSALRWLRQTPAPIGQQGLWMVELEEFNFQIEQRPGHKHTNADALSRKPYRQYIFCRPPEINVTRLEAKQPVAESVNAAADEPEKPPDETHGNRSHWLPLRPPTPCWPPYLQ